MNIPKTIADLRAAYRRRAEQARCNNYDHIRPSRQTAHSTLVTIGDLKAQRLRIKNSRRAMNGLPPKLTYAEI